MGANVRRKEESPLRCLTVKDILDLVDMFNQEKVVKLMISNIRGPKADVSP